MKLFGRKKEKRSGYPYTISSVGEIILNEDAELYTDSKALRLSAVYRAVNVISDAIASMPINVYKYEGNWKKKQYDNLYYLLNVQPNKTLNAFTFKKLLITHLKLSGNAYIYIERTIKNEIKSLNIINPTRVKVTVDANGNKVYLVDNEIVNSDNIIHLINISLDGIIGKSTLEYARTILSGDFYVDQHNKSFFAGGGALNGILTPKDGVFLSEEQAKDAKNAFINQTNPINGGKLNSVVVLSAELDYKPISLSPKDAQLLETKEFNLLSIAQFFGVPLSKLFYTKSNKYNTVEAEQLDFLNSTILPLIEQIEVELYRKIILPSDWDKYEIKFDVANLLRLDANSQAEVYTKYINIGALTPNEVREKLDADYPVTGGNRAFVQQNLQPLDNILNDIKNKE